ncbi:hypothetical protein GCK72_010160 [Caenorhabditis remanei]|uniref:UBX domain-containing protein 4 n=1 Tax=Caenorhabditis remanei TaxID=31234 RepID=A0A6A5H4K1_CAERE|nr:hypothetical protein GCK72_010160 [Caenorhabditis remanei]KAF1761901.1 hypothetical protein GCK72_010160 [Caenorhabditis remanei]
MKWFPGNVTTAIQVSRTNKSLLIVYITNDTEDGRLFDEYWQHIDSSNLLCPVVGIKLIAGETAAKQFADIYPTPIVPAAYLIDQNGKPIEVITTLVGKTYDQFRAKFDKATAQFINSTLASVKPTSSASSTTAPVSSPAARQEPVPVSQETSAEIAEKVARAKSLLEQKKLKDAEKQREAAKQMKEEISKAREAKQDRDDKALMEAAKQRKMEKLEAGKEKERILAQIKADRKDAQKRFGNATNVETNTDKKESTSSSIVGKAVPSDRCRLQIRLPNGSTFVEEFPSNDVLNSLVEIIRQKPSIAGDAFEIQQPYPRRVFTVEDYSKSFIDNLLTPSTALVVVQKSSGSSRPGSGSFALNTSSLNLFAWLFYPFSAIWSVFCGMLGWGQANNNKKDNDVSTEQRSDAGPPRRGMPRSAEVRRRGNVAGLENPNDDDPEERASFNGNSTQFM